MRPLRLWQQPTQRLRLRLRLLLEKGGFLRLLWLWLQLRQRLRLRRDSILIEDKCLVVLAHNVQAEFLPRRRLCGGLLLDAHDVEEVRLLLLVVVVVVVLPSPHGLDVRRPNGLTQDVRILLLLSLKPGDVLLRERVLSVVSGLELLELLVLLVLLELLELLVLLVLLELLELLVLLELLELLVVLELLVLLMLLELRLHFLMLLLSLQLLLLLLNRSLPNPLASQLLMGKCDEFADVQDLVDIEQVRVVCAVCGAGVDSCGVGIFGGFGGFAGFAGAGGAARVRLFLGAEAEVAVVGLRLDIGRVEVSVGKRRKEKSGLGSSNQ